MHNDSHVIDRVYTCNPSVPSEPSACSYFSALLAYDCVGLKWSLFLRSHTAWRSVSFRASILPILIPCFCFAYVSVSPHGEERDCISSVWGSFRVRVSSYLRFRCLSVARLVQLRSAELLMNDSIEAFHVDCLSVFYLTYTWRPFGARHGRHRASGSRTLFSVPGMYLRQSVVWWMDVRVCRLLAVAFQS